MRNPALCLAFLLFAGPSLAATDKMQRSLQKLEPETQMMEVCDLAVSTKIAAETRYSRIDRVVADAIKEPQISGDIFTASGGAFRDRGQWYGLRFTCTLTPDHLAAESVRYAVGQEIPETQWEQFGLWR